MNFLEKDLERILEEQLNNDPEVLYDLGLEHIDYDLKMKVFRQLRIGNYGVADLVTVQRFSDELFIDVYELKKDKIDFNALCQVHAYSKGVQSYLLKRGFNKFRIRKILVGRDFDTHGKFVFVFDDNQRLNFLDTHIFKYHYGIKGILFEEVFPNRFTLIDEGF